MSCAGVVQYPINKGIRLRSSYFFEARFRADSRRKGGRGAGAPVQQIMEGLSPLKIPPAVFRD